MIPDFVKQYREKADQLLEAGRIGDIVFSGGTYQVQILEESGDVWAFLQLSDAGEVSDCFCSCNRFIDAAPCPHLAAAWLALMRKNRPLHIRFKESLWNKLCHYLAQERGYSSDVLEKDTHGIWRCPGFSAKAHGEAGQRILEPLIEHRAKETEKSSIKFSNLSDEEIDRWRQGRPSAQLLYELSFWADLAKWMMVAQDQNHPYDLVFSYNDEAIPERLEISFSEVVFSIDLPFELLEACIPSLAAVDSPLKVWRWSAEDITSIDYDSNEKALIIHGKEVQRPQGEARIEWGKWTYIPRKGFFSSERQGLLAKGRLVGGEVEQALSLYRDSLSRYIQVHQHFVPLKYHLFFDTEWKLHIEAYLFTPGDLLGADDFGSWLFLPAQGFFPIKGREFDSLALTVEDIADFIVSHRVWLNHARGFSTHTMGLSGKLGYRLDERETLIFEYVVEKGEEGEHKDFGSWVYLKGHGFYSKAGIQPQATIQAGMQIARDYIPVFIRMNRSELELVPQFFSNKSPIRRASLKIELHEKDQIEIAPRYDLVEGYQQEALRFFDDWLFVEGEGFSELPATARLPERFSRSVTLSGPAVDTFIAYELESLIPYASTIDPRLRLPGKLVPVAVSMKELSGSWQGVYRLELVYRSEVGSVPASLVWEKVHEKRRYFFSPAGRLELESERFDWLRQLKEAQVEGEWITLSTLELLRVHAFDPIEPGSDEARELLDDLINVERAGTPDITGLTSTLRPYQIKAAEWLWFLYNHGLSGLLCDDMGLGKTHEAMALMAAVKNSSRKRPRFLVVCPTSVIYPWEEKLRQYLPGFKFFVFHGPDRHEVMEEDYDVLITTYGILRNERDYIKKLHFNVAVFDEVQLAKNHNSLTYHSLTYVKARMRLGLTGTPIENQLRELKALFDLVVPGYMPSDARFKEKFVWPIERFNDERQRQLLSRFIYPFVLRRKKEEVLTDLPAKTEEVVHCELAAEQKKLYRELLERSRESILRILSDESQPVPYLHVFALLTQLKQVCNHPAVYLRDVENYQEYDSGKWNLFLELIEEARGSGQKVVVFSQYLAMLDIMELYFRQKGVSFAAIRGATRDRGAQLKKFNSDPSCEVFLGSLQAIGLGVDLTAGSVVIHYDRWWNAAREDQATDRVHRIGQTRGVQVFKLVTIDSFEERIDQLIRQKGRLMERVVGADDQMVVKQFNREELLALLQL